VEAVVVEVVVTWAAGAAGALEELPYEVEPTGVATVEVVEVVETVEIVEMGMGVAVAVGAAGATYMLVVAGAVTELMGP
jgi:hypothetical protein